MSRTRAPAIAGFATLAVIVAAVAVWQLNPFRARDVWVPTCTDLAAPMQATAGGAWSVSQPDGARAKNDTSTLCELAFTSPDQRFSGTVNVYVGGESDEQDARRLAQEADCIGAATPAVTPADYSVYRACAQTVGEKANGTVIAAKGKRWTNLTVFTSIPAGATAGDAIRFAQDTAGKLAEQALTLPEKQ